MSREELVGCKYFCRQFATVQTNKSLSSSKFVSSPLFTTWLETGCAGCNSWVRSARLLPSTTLHLHYPPLSSATLSSNLRFPPTLTNTPISSCCRLQVQGWQQGYYILYISRGDARTRFIHPGSVGFPFKHYDGERVLIKYWFCPCKNPVDQNNILTTDWLWTTLFMQRNV